MIKFRGRVTNTDEPDKWVYGSLVCFENNITLIFPMQTHEIKATLICYEVDPESVGMYVGQEDNGGNEIYCSIALNGMNKGGDVVKAKLGFSSYQFYPNPVPSGHDGYSDIPVIGEIIQSEGCFKLKVKRACGTIWVEEYQKLQKLNRHMEFILGDKEFPNSITDIDIIGNEYLQPYWRTDQP